MWRFVFAFYTQAASVFGKDSRENTPHFYYPARFLVFTWEPLKQRGWNDIWQLIMETNGHFTLQTKQSQQQY